MLGPHNTWKTETVLMYFVFFPLCLCKLDPKDKSFKFTDKILNLCLLLDKCYHPSGKWYKIVNARVYNEKSLHLPGNSKDATWPWISPQMSSHNPAMRSSQKWGRTSSLVKAFLTFLLEIVLKQHIMFTTDLFLLQLVDTWYVVFFFYLKTLLLFFWNIYLFNCAGS